MTEIPILFSGAMVRAILEGRKTQTRRAINPQPVLEDGGCWYPAPPRKPSHRALHYASEAHMRKGLALDFCPYGQPGDRLWVRETWRPEASKRAVGWELFYPADGQRLFADLAHVSADWRRPKAALTGNVPGIHMPRWASRLALEVTEVRVQRLQEISEEDALAEGIERSNDERWPWRNYDPETCGAPFVYATSSFMSLWNSINGERPGCSWEVNPWVWCVSFRRVA